MALPTQIKSLKNLLSTDLHGAMRFEVKGGAHHLGDWSSCVGLSVTFDNKPVADISHNSTTIRPGAPSFTPVTLKRALTHSGAKAVQEWLDDHAKKPRSHGETVEIRLIDSWGKKVVEWKLHNVSPKSWKGADLDGSPSSKSVAMETLELSHDGFMETRKDRPIGGRFELSISGESLGSWSTCEGLGITFDNKQIIEGKDLDHATFVPGKPSYGSLTLKRAMDKSDSKKVDDWLKEHVKKPKTGKCTATVKLYDTWNEKLGEWTFENVIPKAWKGPGLDVAKKDVAVETLELSHSGFHNTNPKVGGTVSVKLGETDLGTWTKVSGLQVEFPTEPRSTHGKTNTRHVVSGPAKWTALKLTRPFVAAHANKVMSWLAEPADGRYTTATVTFLDPWGEPGLTWHFGHVIPTKWTGPSLDAGKSDVLEESLDLVHDGFSVTAPSGGGGTAPQGAGTEPTNAQDNKGKKATTKANETSLERANASLGVDESHSVKFDSDPKSMRVTRSARYLTVPHAVGPKPLGHSRNEYRGSGAATLSLDAELHSPSSAGAASVDKQCSLLQTWMLPAGTGKAPPLLTFKWCSVTFKGYLRDLAIDVTQFGTDLKPSIARVSLLLQEELELPQFTNPTSGGPPGRRIHVLADGDSLQSVAFREYGDAAAWRGLAEANGIDDPMRVRPGTRLALPPAV